MMNDGTIAEMVEKYNVPYFKPFKEVLSILRKGNLEKKRLSIVKY